MGVITLFPGGRKPNLSSIAISVNGIYNAADAGYDGYSSVEVNVLPNLTTLDAIANGSYVPTGYDGYSHVNVNVAPNVNEKYITSNGIYYSSEDGYDGYNKVNVQVPAAVLGNRTFTQNGIFNANSYGLNGFNQVNIQVPKNTFMQKTITANGVYLPSTDNVDGYNSVTVAVPNPSLGTKTITANGTYKASDEGVYGFNNVVVAVPPKVLGKRTFSANGIYNANDYSLDGFNQVTIQVPKNVGPKTITASGIYNAEDDGYYGYSQVNVAVVDDSWKEVIPYNASNNNMSSEMSYHFGYTYNSPTIIGARVVNCVGMFENCRSFNQNIVIPRLVTNCVNMFLNCKSLRNKTITFEGNNVVNCSGMFRYSSNFVNTIPTMPDSVRDISYMFGGVGNKDSSIYFPTSAISNVGHNYINMQFAYSGVNFLSDEAIYIPDSVQNAYGAFYGCNDIRGNFTIGNKCWNIENFFGGYNSFYYTSRVYVRPFTRGNIFVNNSTSVKAIGFLNGYNNISSYYTPDRINIYCNNLYPFIGNAAGNSITGTAITWSTMTNGYYNAQCNIYLYKNYSATTGIIP